MYHRQAILEHRRLCSTADPPRQAGGSWIVSAAIEHHRHELPTRCTVVHTIRNRKHDSAVVIRPGASVTSTSTRSSTSTPHLSAHAARTSQSLRLCGRTRPASARGRTGGRATMSASRTVRGSHEAWRSSRTRSMRSEERAVGHAGGAQTHDAQALEDAVDTSVEQVSEIVRSGDATATPIARTLVRRRERKLGLLGGATERRHALVSPRCVFNAITAIDNHDGKVRVQEEHARTAFKRHLVSQAPSVGIARMRLVQRTSCASRRGRVISVD